MAETIPSSGPVGGIVGVVAKWAQTLTIAALLIGGIWFLAVLDTTVKHNTAAIGDLKEEIRSDIRFLIDEVRAMRDSIDAANAAIAGNREAIAGNGFAIERNRAAIERNRAAIERNRVAIEGNKKAIDELTDRFDEHHAVATGGGPRSPHGP